MMKKLINISLMLCFSLCYTVSFSQIDHALCDDRTEVGPEVFPTDDPTEPLGPLPPKLPPSIDNEPE